MKLLDNGECNNLYGKTIEIKNLIADQECAASDGKTFESRNPSDQRDLVATVPIATQHDVDRALDAAKDAFQQWREVPAPVRAGVIARLGELLAANKETLAFIITREMGKTKKEALGSVQEAIDTARFFQAEGRRLYGQTVPSEMRQKELSTYRKPKGVVGVITPANFPIAVPSWKLIPAILCGNTAVWKPAPDSPAVAYLFGKLWQAAGLPAGVLNIVYGFGRPTGQYLLDAVDAGKVQKISFTGSTAVGRLVGEVCGRNLIIPSLELGGKNPLIVLDDADVDQAVEGALWATYGTGGQRCTSCGNIILQRKIYAPFKSRFLAAMEKLKIGNPILHPEVDYGPMISKSFYERFLEHYQTGSKEGAKLLMGKGRIDANNPWPNFHGDAEQGYYCWPTLWEKVKPPMQLALEEVFGPTTNLIEVADVDAAIQVANAPNYGLSSAIYTSNRQAIYQFKRTIEAGMSSINNSTTGAEAHLPFGGVKGSGNGMRESGIWVIEAYTYWHAINDDLSESLQLAQMDTEYLATQQEVDFAALLP